jgi:hypothetical protein
MSYSRRLDNVLKQIDYVENKVNKDIINEFSKYLILKDASANYQRNCIKVMLMFEEFIKEQKGLNLTQIDSSNEIILFLDSRKRSKEQDPDQKWITTWNDYLWRIKIFYRWYHNTKILKNNIFDSRNWTNSDFINIPKKKTKRLSPYSESEI